MPEEKKRGRDGMNKRELASEVSFSPSIFDKCLLSIVFPKFRMASVLIWIIVLKAPHNIDFN